ncbi:Manganese superoxide dismutase [Mycena indigotica]|uniref:Manganese superoxide dismutase n=1 Tax=Mycena indigotica TaxID=2126181 RepID=A0A8H6W124_9AGAR|nr:Manganese superoxide dismutase [Mycena indigotica]KAF7301604.1 Manganese superoxide dismutase [Mycena indigotica]
MNFLCRSRPSLLHARRSLLPSGSRGVSGQFDHLPLPLPYDIKAGLGNFLPPAALETVAVEYQLGLLARLTDEVRHTEEDGFSVTQTVISTAPHRHKTLAFNYASLALNNSFFLGNLTPDPVMSSENAITTNLARQIRSDHGGVDQLKSAFSAAGMGMFTSGYVWFVTDKYGSTSVIPTFGPGTLLVRSRTYMAEDHPTLWHRQPSTSPYTWDPTRQFTRKYLSNWGVDGKGTIPDLINPRLLSKTILTAESQQAMAELEKEENERTPPPPKPAPSYQMRFMHTSARLRQSSEEDKPNFMAQPASIHGPTEAARELVVKPKSTAAALHIGEVLYPLFCVSVHEHAWLSAGYGVWGKEAWLREFWSVLNWNKVSQAYESILSSK